MNRRIDAIDIFRALTMLLMVFVNDLWTLHGIPGWLEHTEAAEDGMGLADTVFPAFLFIVGLSIPFALKTRLQKGDRPAALLRHLVLRALALIVMGFFMVNNGRLSDSIAPAWHTVRELAMVLAFFLIWNRYRSPRLGKLPVWVLQAAGSAILLTLALTFRSSTPGTPSHMIPSWWGILGIIGWSYLSGSLFTLAAHYTNGSPAPAFRLGSVILGWLLLLGMNILEFVPSSPFPHNLLMVSASHHSLVMAGVVASTLLMRLNHKPLLLSALLTVLALAELSFGFAIRPFHGISKIYATPAWTAICTGISTAVFVLLYLIADAGKYTRWAAFIRPAGVAALTCYLVPDLLYPWLWPLEQLLPAAVLGGGVGLVKSALFALLTVWLTGWLVKGGVELKT